MTAPAVAEVEPAAPVSVAEDEERAVVAAASVAV